MSTGDKRVTSKTSTQKKSASKAGVFDVAHPGKGAAASATARPVIASKGPVVQDPMVVNDDASERETAPVVTSMARLRKTIIQPLHAAESNPHDADEQIDETLSIATSDEPIEPTGAPEVASIESTKQAENYESQSESKHRKASAAKEEVEPNNATAEPATKSSNAIEPDVQDAPPTTAPDDDGATAKIIKEHMLRIENLVESEQYYLPINAVQTRKSRKFVMGGVILIIILAAAWYNIALDAGLLPNLYNLPHTEFFTVK